LDVAIRQLAHFPDAALVAVSRSVYAPHQQLAESTGVAARVHLLGPTNNLARIYRACDLFLYPSDYDAFGMVVSEAMASGLPVIVGRNIGAAEWIRHGQNGLLCDPANEASVRNQIDRVKTDARVARAMGQAARETAREHTWDACATGIESIYERVLKEKSPVKGQVVA
jgi:glycosyltransferase involved in cell wall biosynthesis